MRLAPEMADPGEMSAAEMSTVAEMRTAVKTWATLTEMAATEMVTTAKMATTTAEMPAATEVTTTPVPATMPATMLGIRRQGGRHRKCSSKQTYHYRA